MSTKCLFCGAPATRWCDAVIALVAGEMKRDRFGRQFAVSTMEAMLSTSYTCDASFCSAHGRQVGTLNFRDGGETIDWCAGCQREEPPHGVLWPDEIDKARRERHAKWRRQRFVAVSA